MATKTISVRTNSTLSSVHDQITSTRPLQLRTINNNAAAAAPIRATLGSPITRETGVVEKLLHSYGFIQCCDRDARLFFHFSEFKEKIDQLKVGDNVEFEMSCDKRTGKPIAIGVHKTKGTSFEIISDERMVGTVLIQAKHNHRNRNMNNPSVMTEGLGQVTFERSGECFFLPYAMDDLEDGPGLPPGSTDLHCGDVVSFFIATDKRNGLMHARKIQLVKPPMPTRYQGVVCSMRESYGFIERADIVREIFFHYTEYSSSASGGSGGPGDIGDLSLGDDVEFDIEVKQGKEYAISVTTLPPGTVIFEDIALETMRGRVKRTLKAGQSRRLSDPLSGRLVYETIEGSQELPYGDKDQVGEYTLFEGDIVEFNISTDRRDQLQRATNIRLVEDTFLISREKRETGIVAMLNKGYGFITCLDRDARMFFHFSEVMEPDSTLQLEDELEFTVIQDPANPDKPLAIRMKVLPKNSATLSNVSGQLIQGTVQREPAAHKTPNKNKSDELGSIYFHDKHTGERQSVIFQPVSSNGFLVPKCGDKVEFQISELVRNGRRTAVNIRVLERNSQTRFRGFIAALKDTYGFVENEDHEKEVFFHFSSFEGDTGSLDMGDEVEYTVTRKGTKYSAENITRLAKGTVAPEDVESTVYDGKVIRPMRIVDPEQEEYWGVVQMGFHGDDGKTYPYGITGLADKRDFLQAGDIVKFQLSTVRDTGKVMATNIAGVRKYIRAPVDSVKGQYGFIDYEATEGRKLFFHMTEVHDHAEIHPGDAVEFVVVQNQRNGRYAAVSVRKIDKEKRPEHLAPRRLRSLDDFSGPKMVLTRSPRGPVDGTGFSRHPFKNN